MTVDALDGVLPGGGPVAGEEDRLGAPYEVGPCVSV
jgi:hypothetical protein